MMKKWKQSPKWVKLLVYIFLFLILSEIILRFIIGLGDIALYREDKNYEYFYRPNQSVYRFGNHIVTNEYGMRSKSVDNRKRFTILEFGDSVLNGGAHVDQDNLSTSIQDKTLNQKFQNQVQVLNVSAQSWGPSNAFSFLKKHGDFNADVIVLTFSSHDLNDNMHFRKVVGIHSAWPDQKPCLAITDAWTRFLLPKLKSWFGKNEEYDYLIGFNDSKVNTGWRDFFNYTKKNHIRLIVYLHASIKEVKEGEYNLKGKKIIEFCQKNNITIVTDLILLSNNEDAFIDDIHLNKIGHSIMAKLLLPVLEESFNKSR